MTITEIRQILESPYDRKVWKNFLQSQFTNNKLNAEDRAISLSDKTLSKKKNIKRNTQPTDNDAETQY